jgi:hypothetical protein
MRYVVGDRVRARRNLLEANMISALHYAGANIMEGHPGRVTWVQLGLWDRELNPMWNWFRDTYEVRFDGVELSIPGLTSRDVELDKPAHSD